MTIGSSIFLVVVGAILRYAVTWTIASVNLHIVGLILMIAGIVGFVLSVAWMFQPRQALRRVRRRAPVEPDYQPPYGAPYGERGLPPTQLPPTRAYDDRDAAYGDPEDEPPAYPPPPAPRNRRRGRY